MENMTMNIERMERQAISARQEITEAKVRLSDSQESLHRIQQSINDLKKEVSEFEEQRKHLVVDERKSVIEQAKSHIDRFLKLAGIREEVITFNHLAVIPQYHVNKEKRTVTCLLHGAGSGRLRSKGIARTAPSDVFNVHIGKAIAFSKAMEEPIPEVFMNAPEPKEAEVGDIVEWSEGRIKLTERIPEHDGKMGFGKAFLHTAKIGGWLGEEQFTIVDDSKDE